MQKHSIVGSISIQMVKGMTINSPKHMSHKYTGLVDFCSDQKVDQLLAEVSNKRRSVARIANNNIIVMDLDNTKCRELLSKEEIIEAQLRTLILLDGSSDKLQTCTLSGVPKKCPMF